MNINLSRLLKPIECFIIIFILALFFSAHARALDNTVLKLLQETVSITDEKKLKAKLTAIQKERSISLHLLSKHAAMISRKQGFSFNKAYADAALRLLMSAYFLEQKLTKDTNTWIYTTEITQLNQADIVALRNETGYPDETDPILYLLRRNPKLNEAPSKGIYTVITSLNEDGSTLLRESSNTNYFNLSDVPSYRVISENEAVPISSQGEIARTRKFELPLINPIILAAKAARVVQNTKDPLLGLYASIVLAHALYSMRIFAIESEVITYNTLTYFSKLERNLIKHSKGDAFLISLAANLNNKITSSAFFARDFELALERYSIAAKTVDKSLRYRTTSEYGRAISLLAMRKNKESTISFIRLSNLLARDNIMYWYNLEAVLVSSTIEESLETKKLLNTARVILKNAKLNQQKKMTYDDSLLRILRTAGRFMIASRHIIRRLTEIRRDNTFSGSSEVELFYLHELGAFSRDLGYLISFNLSHRGEWEPRVTNNYPRELDFLHHLLPNNAVPKGGVVIQKMDNPYGMSNPEEDFHTIGYAYGSLSLNNEITSAIPGVELGAWAKTALIRKTPAHSTVPYMKLIWYEWFFESFDPIKKRGFSPRNFVYKPLNNSKMTTSTAIVELLISKSKDSFNIELLNLFKKIRLYLEENYAK